ncbi:MAG: hypothetical protein AMXMBFR47_29940 [Planctomycetota bacterium]
MAASHIETMQCMEIWGGNRSVDGGVALAGLDAWVFSRPHAGAEAGGDVHYVSSCATGRITRLLVADVSGHGESVSATASSLRSLMRRFVNYVDQTRFVRSMNGEFSTLALDGTFATAIVNTYYAPTGELTLCNAGHPPPLLYRAEARTWSLLEGAARGEQKNSGNLPLGIVELAAYDQFALRLRPGDMVLCYTDSLIEATDPSGEWIGPRGLLRLIQGLDTGDPGAIIPALLAAVRGLAPGNLHGDDVTVLLFRPNGRAPRAPFAQRVLAPIRVLAGIIGSWLPGGQPAPLPELSLRNLLGFSPRGTAADEAGG